MERKNSIAIKDIEASTEIDVFPEDVKLASKWYGDKTNTTGTLDILHCLDVANILKHNLKYLAGSEQENFRILYLAALGHDLLEDTDVDTQEVEKHWDKEVLNLINALTNIKGDKHTSEYSENLSKANEDVRLIKLADILSNVNNTLREFDHFDLKNKNWVIDTWIPMLNQYDKVVLPTPWHKYQNVASLFNEEIRNKIFCIKEIAGGYFDAKTREILELLDLTDLPSAVEIDPENKLDLRGKFKKVDGFYSDPIKKEYLEKVIKEAVEIDNDPSISVLDGLEAPYLSNDREATVLANKHPLLFKEEVYSIAQYLVKLGFDPYSSYGRLIGFTKYRTADPNIGVYIKDLVKEDNSLRVIQISLRINPGAQR